MNNLKREVNQCIHILYEIKEINEKIRELEKKNFKNGQYSPIELILGVILCILSIVSILYFFHNSLMFIGIDLVEIFFYSNNLLLIVIILILTVFSGIEGSIFIIDKLTFKALRDEWKMKKWHTFYIHEIEKLKIEKNKKNIQLKSSVIPQTYMHSESLLFFKEQIENLKINDLNQLIELYRIHMAQYKNQCISILLSKNKK